MTLKEKIKEFDEIMLELPVNTSELYFEGINGEKIETARMATVKSFLKSAIQEALESLQGEKADRLEYTGIYADGWDDREKKLREDISKFLNN